MAEPTNADVLTAIRDLRSTTVQAHADLRRDIQRRLENLQHNVHLEIRALDSRTAVIEAAVQEIRELAQELLGLTHTHPEGAL